MTEFLGSGWGFFTFAFLVLASIIVFSKVTAVVSASNEKMLEDLVKRTKMKDKDS